MSTSSRPRGAPPPNTDEAFLDAIYAMANNLKEADEISPEVLDLFFKLAKDRVKLPENSDKDTIDAFLTTLIALMSHNVGSPAAVKALEVLFNFIKNDPPTFARFRPSQGVLRRLNLDHIIGSENIKESDLGLDFATFILRYYRNVSYNNFSADEVI